MQERNLYAWATFDPQQLSPLLETGDPGEPRQRGGQAYARIGKGHYVYMSHAWFRQPRRRAGRVSAVRQPAQPGPDVARLGAQAQAQAGADRVQAIVAVQAGEARIDAHRVEPAIGGGAGALQLGEGGFVVAKGVVQCGEVIRRHPAI